MRGKDILQFVWRSLPRRIAAIAAMVGLIAGALSLTVFAQNSYIITDGDAVTVHKSYSDDPAEVLQEVGIELSEEDTYTATFNDGVARIEIQRMQLVTVSYRGEDLVVGTYGETVESLLSRLDLTIAAGDVLSCEPDASTYDGMLVEVVHRQIEIVEYDEAIPYETRYYEDPELAAGEYLVLIEGQDGTVHKKEQVVYENGVEASRSVLDETVLSQAVTCLIITGPDREITAQPDEPDHRVAYPDYMYDRDPDTPESVGVTDVIGDGTITTSTGVTYTYSRTITCLATAYSCEGRVGTTATGTVARVGAIAVDPKVIPLGTKMYVVSADGEYVYGYCTAEDTGGLIKGYRLDLYFDTFEECYGFGARNCLVYILTEG